MGQVRPPTTTDRRVGRRKGMDREVGGGMGRSPRRPPKAGGPSGRAIAQVTDRRDVFRTWSHGTRARDLLINYRWPDGARCLPPSDWVDEASSVRRLFRRAIDDDRLLPPRPPPLLPPRAEACDASLTHLRAAKNPRSVLSLSVQLADEQKSIRP